MHVLKFKSKYSITLYQYSFSTFNFEQVFASRVRKTSRNVLKTILQGLFHSAIYHCTQLRKITITLSSYYDMNILLTYVSQANNHRFVPLFDLLYHCYFPQRSNPFSCVKTKTYLNH